MVNGWHQAPVRRRSCGGEKGKTLRRGWNREVGELCEPSVPEFLDVTRQGWTIRADASYWECVLCIGARIKCLA